MDQDELKRKLMGLWEKTTHVSKDLVSIFFEYYFDVKYIEYKELDSKIISALFGIPYLFGNGNKHLKGLYIIYLSSEEGYRKKGILAELLNNFNNKLEKEFDFTFLVPHTELLADYFGTQNYFSSFFVLEERYTPLHDFKNDYILSLNESEERLRELKKGLLQEIKVVLNEENIFSKDQIFQFISNIEQKGKSSVSILHSAKDIDYILQEENLRNITSFISYDSDGRITGIAFTRKEELKRIKVIANYVDDYCSYYALLEFIKHYYPDYSISVMTLDPKTPNYSLVQQNYASSNPAGGDLDNTFGTVEIPFNINKLLQPLGMVRLLRFENIIEFLAQTRSDIEFQLFIRDYMPEKRNTEDSEELNNKEELNLFGKIFKVKNGRLNIEPYDNNQQGKNLLILTKKELSELLLRKSDSSNLIMEAFGIPRLNLQFRLLPC